MKRAPNKDDKIAAVLLMLKLGEKWLIPEPTRSRGTSKEICRCVQWHHTKEWAIFKETKPQALTPLPHAEHATITRKVSVPKVAKFKRQEKEWREFTESMARKSRGEKPARRRKGRPIPGSKDSKWKRKMSGRAELRP